MKDEYVKSIEKFDEKIVIDGESTMFWQYLLSYGLGEIGMNEEEIMSAFWSVKDHNTPYRRRANE